MKRLLTILLFISTTAGAKNYYISASGNDNTNNGTTTGTPWRTVTKINATTFVTGDSILFKRGETFIGGIVINQAGVNLGAYGTGAKPIITGVSTITGWASLGGNIWQATTSGVKTTVNLVLRDGVIQQVGRFPNSNAANKGYLVNTGATATTINGPAVSTTTNWTGAEVVMRVARFTIDRQKVTAHSGATVTFNTNANIAKTGYGYFFQRDPRTLDQDGEWYEGTNQLRMYFANNNPTAYTIQAASVDTLLKFTRANCSVTGIAFYGAGVVAVHCSGAGFKITDFDVNNSGSEAVTTAFVANITVSGGNINNSLSSGIRVQGTSSGTVNLKVTNNIVRNTLQFAGMGSTGISSSNKGIVVLGGDGVTVTGNQVFNSGYNGIAWQGNNALIKNNIVMNFCSTMDDGGGIYTWENAKGSTTFPARFNRLVTGNIVVNGIGASAGTNTTGDGSESSVVGIYLDDNTRSVRVEGNTIGYVPANGIHGNINQSDTITNNTIYNCGWSISFQTFETGPRIASMLVDNNILYPFKFRYRDLGILSSKEASLIASGNYNHSYYSKRPGVDTSVDITAQPPTNNSRTYQPFSYLTGTIGQELQSTQVLSGGSLFYNPSDTPLVISFPGARKIDVKGVLYDNQAIIPRWGSLILINNGTVASHPSAIIAPIGDITSPVSQVTLTSASTDADGTIASVLWSKTMGTGGTITNAADSSTTFTGLTPGVYQVRLIVTDNSGLKDTTYGSFTVNPPVNTPPTANAGGTKQITLPANSLSVTGIATDAEGSTTVQWTQNGSSPSVATISNGNTASATFSNLVAGIYSFRFAVTDAGGLTNADNMQLIVNTAIRPANTPPVVDADTNRVVMLPATTTTLKGTATDNGPIVSYEWVKLSGPAGPTIASPSTATTDINGLGAGTFTYKLTATDNGGLTGTDTVTITVIAPANIPPTVEATPVDTVLISPVSSYTVSAVGTDQDGTIASYKWVKLSGGAATITNPTSAITTITGLSEGVYNFQVKVKDNSGDSVVATVKVTVTVAPTNVPPSANAGGYLPVYSPTNSILLSGSGQDADGTIVGYSWTIISGPSGSNFGNALSSITSFNNLAVGDYVVQLTVTDNNGQTGTDQVTITVLPEPPGVNEGVSGRFQIGQ